VRIPVIAGNWKMHKTGPEGAAMVTALLPLVRDAREVEIVICPPFTALEAVGRALAGSAVRMGAQDVHWQAEGAYTGEVSAGMLVAVGCSHVIIGHSERRQYFGETDELVNRKVKAALSAGLVPILCVGETLEQREAGQTEEICRTQVEGGLKGLAPEQVKGVIIAYEPVWAIGTGRTASPQDAQQVIRSIRQVIREIFGEAAEAVRIQYGGSVKPENAAELMAQPDIDGALVGGASLQAETFAAIINYR